MYCHGQASPSVSGRQQSRLCTAMAKHHPQCQADSSPDCVLPWPSIILSVRQSTVQTVSCHGLASSSVSGRQQSRLCTAMAKHHPQCQADSSPDCVLPWPSIILSLRQTAVRTVSCHGLASSSVSGRHQSRLCPAMAKHHPQSHTAVQTVYCHGQALASVSGRQQSRLCPAMAKPQPQPAQVMGGALSTAK